MAWELVEETSTRLRFLNGLSADSFYYVSPARRDGPESVKRISGQEGRGQELAESLIANPNYALDDF